jgi:cytochrome b561
MKENHRLKVHWGILLIVYFAVLFGATMVELTSGAANSYMLLLLAAGIPIYLVAARSIMWEPALTAPGASAVAGGGEAIMIQFPNRKGVEIANATAESRGHQLRKLG